MTGAHDGPINILIVDDEPANLVVLETVLDDPGYRLVRAGTPDEALLALVEEEFALLILDIRMPGMTGFELAQIIKQRRKTAGVPIIFLTAYYDKDQHEGQGYGTGAVDFLNKPVNPTILRSKVAVFADLHRKSRAIAQANAALTAEVQERRRIEEQLRELNDTLERRVSERSEALRLADRKLQGVLATITDGLLTLDRQWRFTFVNAQGARLLGRQPDELIGTAFWALFPAAGESPFFEGFQRAVAKRETVAFEAFCGEPLNIWLECRCYPADEELSVYFHDIGQRREVERRREQLLAAEQAARSEGERVGRAKDEFLALLSHELRTPLAAIAGWAKVLERPGLDAPTIQRGVDAIARNARAQANLVDDLLDMSRIISGKLRVNAEPVALDAIAAAAADTARPNAQAKGVHIELRGGGAASADIVGDALRLQQVVANLVTNALKFTPAGGTVTIATAADATHAELTVADSGQGIAADFLPHLFDRFSQADGSAARRHGGLGLGLAIVKSLTELQGGSVRAHSDGEGQGASFTLRFPRAAAAAAVGPAAARDAERSVPTDEPAELQNVAVLLVDDHPDALEVQCRLLRECGAAVTTAASAAGALQALRTQRFDILLSDLGMPEMDGYAFIDHVRGALAIDAQRLPAAAITAFVRPEDRERAIDAGFQACLQKPVDPMLLAHTVRRLADSRGARLRALFVEDHADLREQIGWQLEEEQLDVVACASAEEAEAIFARPGGFDVVITDVSLPKMSGTDLARRLIARSPQTWVVFSTGYALGPLASFGPRVRALLKPFEADELHRLMDEVRADLAERRSAARA